MALRCTPRAMRIAYLEVNPIRKNDLRADPWPDRRTRRAVKACWGLAEWYSGGALGILGGSISFSTPPAWSDCEASLLKFSAASLLRNFPLYTSDAAYA